MTNLEKAIHHLKLEIDSRTNTIDLNYLETALVMMEACTPIKPLKMEKLEPILITAKT